jgi:hypothetical protein
MNSPIATRLAFAAAIVLGLFAVTIPAAGTGLEVAANFFGVPITEMEDRGRSHEYITETLRNTTGQDANDLHVEILSVEQRIGIVSSNEFPPPRPMPVFGSNNVTADFSGEIDGISDGVVPAGETVRVSWQLFTEEFRIKESRISSHYFTHDGEPIGIGESPNLSVQLEAATDVFGVEGISVKLRNHDDQFVILAGQLFTADGVAATTGDLGRLNDDANFRLQKNFTSYGTFGGTILPGQSVVAQFIPNRTFSEPPPPPSSEFTASAVIAASMHEGEEAAILAGERIIGLALFNVSNGTNMALGILLVPEPALTPMILMLGGALVLRRGRRR